MESRLLSRLFKVACHIIGQRSFKLGMGRMDQHTRRFIHRQNMVIFIQNGQFSLLGRVFRLPFFQADGDHIPALHRKIRVLRLTVNPDRISPF